MKTIFISYSHKDELWKDRFKPHVSMLEKAGLDIVVWDDRKINVGEAWYPEITQAMEQEPGMGGGMGNWLSCDLFDFLNLDSVD